MSLSLSQQSDVLDAAIRAINLQLSSLYAGDLHILDIQEKEHALLQLRALLLDQLYDIGNQATLHYQNLYNRGQGA